MSEGGRQQTISETLRFTDHQYRLYTAIHEIGHAATGLATGNCSVDACELTITPGAATDAYTDISWVPDHTAQHTQLIFLHGGLLAQEQWMRETRLWTPERTLAARSGARHDFAAMEQLATDESSVRKACDESRKLMLRYWRGITEAAQLLCDTGRITGQEICDLLNRYA
ncbi:hypothetical protein ACFWXE_15055 [[Kitasatospora] papulosa]|uniref:hypothetical protein n=1 Tax=Streptomyces TaxID=1883 RepID=UPI0005E32395|nr:hypothetical protein [Streptomyces sp. MNU77]OLO25894.1 hypothetical protein PZ61_0236405 [Streptomyces sp. MNU77]